MKRFSIIVLALILLTSATLVAAQSEILKAVENGDLEAVKTCIKNGADVNSKNDRGWTTLHWAAFKGHLKIAEYLIQQGAEVDALAKNNNNKTPLMLAALEGKANVVDLLIKNGANVSSKDRDGSTALHMAAASGHYKAVKLLIEKGAIVNAKDVMGFTPLFFAKSNYRDFKEDKYLAVIKVLKANGAK
ncbi:ankyrin repeat domain-containing protein [bacterium]|nr:ankyrin repeat domain-containing protein [bacterium]